MVSTSISQYCKMTHVEYVITCKWKNSSFHLTFMLDGATMTNCPTGTKISVDFAVNTTKHLSYNILIFSHPDGTLIITILYFLFSRPGSLNRKSLKHFFCSTICNLHKEFKRQFLLDISLQHVLEILVELSKKSFILSLCLFGFLIITLLEHNEVGWEEIINAKKSL